MYKTANSRVNSTATRIDYELYNKDKKLQLYFPKAFNRRKRQSVDINKRILQTDTLNYNEHTRAISIKNTRASLPITANPATS